MMTCEQQTILMAGSVNCYYPTAGGMGFRSPDGSTIAFNSQRNGRFEVHLMNQDGSSQRPLVSSIVQDEIPCWSPNGQQLVFEVDMGGREQIFKVNVDGSGLTRLTNTSHSDGSPSWKPVL